jgi:hypothetical protein
MNKGKGKAGKGGAGGGPSTKAAAGSSGQGSSGQGSSRPSAPPARIIGLSTEEDAVQAAPPLAAETAGAQTEPEPQPAGGNTKKKKERQRKERQRQRKEEEAWEALQVALEEQMDETAGAKGVDAVEKAMHAAEKHEARSEKLAALVAEAKGLIEQAWAAEAEQVRVAAEAVEAAAVVEAAAAAEEAAERLQAEGEMAALTLRMQQMQPRLDVPPAAPAPHLDAEETMCVVCMDAPKNRVVLPCMHTCVCKACAQLLRDRCPVCRGPIERISQLFT